MGSSAKRIDRIFMDMDSLLEKELRERKNAKPNFLRQFQAISVVRMDVSDGV